MPLTVFLAVLLAALLHAVWNAMVKGDADKRLAMVGIVTGQSLFGLAVLPFAPIPNIASLPWMLAGIGLHAGYQLFLLSAYRFGDLTQVYPLARGSAPMIVTVVSVLFLGVSLGRMELIGVGVIAIGVFSLGLVRRRDGQRNPHAAWLALATGCFIASYSLVDGLGAREAGTALGFYSWMTIGNGIIIAAIAAWRWPESLRRLPREGWRVTLIGGGASFLAYALVVWAFTEAPIALVTALRESSIVFALLIGVFVLREKLDLMKVFSTMMTLIGVALMRLARMS